MTSWTEDWGRYTPLDRSPDLRAEDQDQRPDLSPDPRTVAKATGQSPGPRIEAQTSGPKSKPQDPGM